MNKKPLALRIRDGKYLLLLMVPCVATLIVFSYAPMWGVLYSFIKFAPGKGMLEMFEGIADRWRGLDYFIRFFKEPFTYRLIKNTFLLSLYTMLWSFPIPIIFALVLTEVRTKNAYRRIVQSVSYLPHFISIVVVCGMIKMFLMPGSGFISNFFYNIGAFGGRRHDLLSDAKWFRTIYVSSDIWKTFGWSSIIYIAAIAGVDPGLYESALIDGAGRFRRVVSITVPSIAPTIITLMLLSIGSLLSVGFEKVFLLQTTATYSTSDVISTYVYRIGLKGGDFSYATAVGLFNSVVNLAFLIVANTVAKRVSETSLW